MDELLAGAQPQRILPALQKMEFNVVVDLFLTPWGEIVFNEVNTIPGFTPHSRYPAMMRAAGIPFRELVSRLIQLGAEL